MSTMKQENTKKKYQAGGIGDYGILLALAALWLVMAVSNEYFFNVENIMNIFRESAFVGVTAIGMTFVIMTKGIDLSVGGILSVLGVTALLMIPQIGIFLTIVLVLILGAAAGLLNGLLIVRLRIPPFITTLGTYYIFKSIAYMLSDAKPVVTTSLEYTQIGNGALLGANGIPYPFIIFLICVLIAVVVQRNLSFGRNVMAIGNSEKASYVSGINVRRIKTWVYVILGICTAISAILLSSRLWTANAELKASYEFDVITVVVMGGCALAGGRGNIINTFISAIFFVTIANALTNYNVDPYWQYVIKGFILLVAFSMYNIKDLVVEYMEKQKRQKLYMLEDRAEAR